ncbi:unnamed protein product [Sphagnum balticum]
MERPSEFRLLLQSKEQELINLCDQQIQSLHTRIREKEEVEANLAARISQLQDDFKVGPWIAGTMIELFGSVTGEVDSQFGRQTDALLAMRSIIFHYWILEMLSLHSTTQQRLHSR